MCIRDSGNTVHNVDGIELTHIGAVAQTNAGKGAGLGAAVQCSSGCTGLDALVIMSRLAVLVLALTLDNRLLFHSAGRAAHRSEEHTSELQSQR